MRTLRFNIMNRLILIILLTFILGSCKKQEDNTQNHLPTADFSVVPLRAEVGDSLYFDAGIVSDKEDPTDKLQVQWSWTGLNSFTQYTLDKTAIHTYGQVGVYFPKVVVKDTYTLTDTSKQMVVIVNNLENMPPEIPILLTPPEWETWMEPTIVFKWKSGTDPEDDPQTFDLWVGLSIEDMSIIRSNISDYTNVGGEQVYETTETGFQLKQDYYWQVAARDPNGNYTPGRIWKFTTKPE